jgi:iron complex transport system ATP-binding protein
VAAPAVTPAVEALRLHVRHAGATRDAVRDLTLRIGTSEIVALVGPNGSGKSTALAALARVLPARQGSVRVGGVDVKSIGRRALARRMAFLPQEPACPEGLTVGEVVACGRHARATALGRHLPAERAAVTDALALLDLVDLRDRTMQQLSGGERRRAWLAMLMAQQAPVILLDEPTAALDLLHRWEVLDLLLRINRDLGTTIVTVLHDLAEVARIAHRAAVLFRGRLYAAGPPAACLRAETLRDVFAVETEVTFASGAPRIDVIRPTQPLRRL